MILRNINGFSRDLNYEVRATNIHMYDKLYNNTCIQ